MIFNMIAMGASTGGGGLDNTNALIIVTVPAGSTVRAVNDGLIKTPTMWIADESASLEKAVFQIPPIQFDENIPWTITASDGTNTASANVLVTSNKEYELKISYHVPAGYKEVEYIIFSAGAYINTRINANTSRSIEIKVFDTGYLNDRHYFGGTGSSGTEYHMTSYNNKYYWGSGSGENSGGNWTAGEKTFTYNNAQHNYIPTLNGADLTTSNSETLRNYNIWLGKRGNDANFAGNLYYCYIRNNADQSLAFEGYPCYRIADSVVGLWDKVSETLFVNAGSGVFTAGPDVL